MTTILSQQNSLHYLQRNKPKHFKKNHTIETLQRMHTIDQSARVLTEEQTDSHTNEPSLAKLVTTQPPSV